MTRLGMTFSLVCLQLPDVLLRILQALFEAGDVAFLNYEI